MEIKFEHSFVLVNDAWEEPALMTLTKGYAELRWLNSGKEIVNRKRWSVKRYADNLYWTVSLNKGKVYDYYSYKNLGDKATPLKSEYFKLDNYVDNQIDMYLRDRN